MKTDCILLIFIVHALLEQPSARRQVHVRPSTTCKPPYCGGCITRAIQELSGKGILAISADHGFTMQATSNCLFFSGVIFRPSEVVAPVGLFAPILTS